MRNQVMKRILNYAAGCAASMVILAAGASAHHESGNSIFTNSVAGNSAGDCIAHATDQTATSAGHVQSDSLLMDWASAVMPAPGSVVLLVLAGWVGLSRYTK
jgi:hypothetical protein